MVENLAPTPADLQRDLHADLAWVLSDGVRIHSRVVGMAAAALRRAIAAEAQNARTYCAYCGFEAAVDADASVIAQHILTCEKHPIQDVMQQRDHLQEFKDWVHDWLDANDIPADPNPEQTTSTGCRISGRLEYLLQARNEAIEVAAARILAEHERDQALAVAAARASGDPAVRDLLLHEFGTTDPRLLADAIQMERDIRRQIEAERDRLAAAIRKHRDTRGDDRCHLDDGELYAVLRPSTVPCGGMPAEEDKEER